MRTLFYVSIIYHSNIKCEVNKSDIASCICTCMYAYVIYMYVCMFKYILLSLKHNIKMPFSIVILQQMGKLELYILGTSQIIQGFILYSFFFLQKQSCLYHLHSEMSKFCLFCFYYNLKSTGSSFSFSTQIASQSVNASDTSMNKSNK